VFAIPLMGLVLMLSIFLTLTLLACRTWVPSTWLASLLLPLREGGHVRDFLKERKRQRRSEMAGPFVLLFLLLSSFLSRECAVHRILFSLVIPHSHSFCTFHPR
jgi:hypothetical protein